MNDSVKILDLIPKQLHPKLFLEVAEEMKAMKEDEQDGAPADKCLIDQVLELIT